MKIHNVAQNSEEWHKLRSGLFTASNFGKIITATGKKSTQFDALIFEVAANLIAGVDLAEGFAGSSHTERGHELEPEAAAFYELQSGLTTETVGFCVHESGKYGCSPDRLVGDNGLLEIKCPAGKNHLVMLSNNRPDSKYIPQLQGQLFVTGREWCDFISYHPSLPAFIIRVQRDEAYIETMQEYLDEAHNKLTKICEQIKSRYF